MDFEELKRWAAENHIEQRATESCWSCLKSYPVENAEESRTIFGEIDFQKFSIKIRRLALYLENWPKGSPVLMVAYIPIRYDNAPRGMYRVMYSMTGEVVDDSLEIYDH